MQLLNEQRFFATAQICEKGHLITMNCEDEKYTKKNHCPTCGSKTITRCPSCNEPIQGASMKQYQRHTTSICWVDNVDNLNNPPTETIRENLTTNYEKPAYCHSCGNKFPWMDLALKSAKELIELQEELSVDEKNTFIDNVENVTSDTASTLLSATKMSNVLKKISPIANNAIKETLYNVLAEVAKRTIWPNH